MFWDGFARRAMFGVCIGCATWLASESVQASPEVSGPLARHRPARSALGGMHPHADLPAVRASESDRAAELHWRPRAAAPQFEASPNELPAESPEAAISSDEGATSNGELSYVAEDPRDDAASSEVADAADSLTGVQAALCDKVRGVLDFYQQRLLNTRENNCWELMHAIVAFGVHSEVRRGAAKGPAVNSIAWLCSGAACAGEPLMYIDQGRVTAAKGPRVQGHHGQFLAILAQSKVMPDYPILVNKRSFSIEDLIETEKLSCFSKTELTFKLISFAHYLDSDATWKNSQGENWSIERLIREEIAAPINGAPCGGTHRLMGLSYAVHERIKQEQPVDGEFLRAQTYVNDYHRYAFRLQNRDGSFSTDWFKGRAAKADLDRRLQTSGHILEWLAYSVDDETLDDPRFIKAVSYLAGILDADRNRAWSVGPLGHGLHALAIYEERMDRRGQSEPPAKVARREVLRDEESPPPELSPATESSQPVIVPVVPRRSGVVRPPLPRREPLHPRHNADETDRD